MQKNGKPQKKPANGAQTAPKVIAVTFALQLAEAKAVFLCGDFNNWSPTASRMIRHEGNGRWQKCLTLSPGRYEYKFIVDGEWKTDPAAPQNAVNPFGSINSVLEVRV